MNGVTGMTSSAQAFTFLAGGTVADVFTTARATILAKKFSYIVTGAEDSSGSGNLGTLAAQITTQALPINNIRQRLVTGNVDAIGTVTAFAIALNNTRAEVVWQPNSNLMPSQLAARAAGAYAVGESSTVPVLNWDSLGASPTTAALWPAMASQFDGSAPTRADISSALSSGVTPLSTVNGSSYLVSRVTTYCRDSGGNLDTRVRDAHIVTVMDLFAQTLQIKVTQQFGNKLIANDPVKGGKTPGSQVVTPMILDAAINKLIRQFGENSLLQNVELSVAATQVIRESSPDSRMSARVQLQPISLAHQFAFNLDQTSF
jgi:phage tail sheath gpL-like